MTSKNLCVVTCIFVLAGSGALLVQGCGGSSTTGGDSGPTATNEDANMLSGTGGALGTGGDILGSGGVGIGGAQAGLGGGVQPGTGGSALSGTGGSSPLTCGGPGTPCCAANNCNGGGCCVSGICMAPGGACVGLGGGTCNAGSCGACGSAGQPCCGSATATATCTAPNTKCNAGTCSACGALGTPCCDDPAGGAGTCNSPSAVCSNNLCVSCGTPGSDCCPGSTCAGTGCCFNNTCVSETTACGTTGGTCQAGRCSGCGSAGQTCCSTSCYDGLTCKSGLCASCAHSGETCCPTSGNSERCQAGFACSSAAADGVCARCGSLGDVCCNGDKCTDGCCSGGRCVASTGSCTTTPPDASISPDAPITGTGGKLGAGGITGAGGSVITGGVIGAGGTVGTGGVTGSGGIIGTGGATVCTITTNDCGTRACGTGTDNCGNPVACATCATGLDCADNSKCMPANLIDDFSSCTGAIPVMGGRLGYWYLWDNSSTSLYPLVTGGSKGLASPPSTWGITQCAAWMRGGEEYLTGDESAGLGVTLNGTSPYNTCNYTGIEVTYGSANPVYLRLKYQVSSTLYSLAEQELPGTSTTNTVQIPIPTSICDEILDIQFVPYDYTSFGFSILKVSLY